MSYRIAIVNLGCPKNTVDAEEMAGVLKHAGHEIVGDPALADAVIVNTCGFIKSASDESIQTLSQLRKTLLRTGAKLIAAGCLPQRIGASALSKHVSVDAVVGVGQMSHINELVTKCLDGSSGDFVPQVPVHDWAAVSERVLSTPAWSAYLKISEGCDHRCAFCTIPSFRGKHVSKPMDRVMAEAQNLAQMGVKELIVIAQDTTQYGLDIAGRSLLPELLRELDALHCFTWIRVMYAYPTRLDDKMIECLTSLSSVVPYIDMPLQHSEDELLSAMRRSHRREQTLNLLKKLRAANPDISLRTSMIVGYPGETEEQFENLLRFCDDVQFDRLGAFIFSAEEGTLAADLPERIPAKVAQNRYNKLMRHQKLISHERNRLWVGRTIQVLVESRVQGKPRVYQGRSFRDAPEIDGSVFVTGENLTPGEFVNAVVTSADSYDLFAKHIVSLEQ